MKRSFCLGNCLKPGLALESWKKFKESRRYAKTVMSHSNKECKRRNLPFDFNEREPKPGFHYCKADGLYYYSL